MMSEPNESIGAYSMPIPEYFAVQLVGTRDFPRYVLVHNKDKYYIGFNAGWGPLCKALIYASLKKITTELLLLERERLNAEWLRMSEEEEDENNEDDTK
jgi:hypothetical protein